MANGDFTIFEEAMVDIGNGVHDFETHLFKMGLVNNTGAPTAVDGTPRWADYVANESTPTGSAYVLNGPVVSGNFTISEAAGVMTWDPGLGPHLDLLIDSGGPTDIFWGILYNSSATNDEAIGFVEFTGGISLVDGAISYTFASGGILTIGP